jgi:lysyl-tRNA synthetase class 1
VPDFLGCHESISRHFAEEFLNYSKNFLSEIPEVFSLSKAYNSGEFLELALQITKQFEVGKRIISLFQNINLGDSWSPWKPVCPNCGKLSTTKVVSSTDSVVEFKCEDFDLETTTIKGCGFKGSVEIAKTPGRLLPKGELAVQWKHWNVCCAGFSTEQQSKNSIFWSNAEISERILNFPMPEAFFFERLAQENSKKQNPVLPKDWLECSRPEALRLLFLKRLSKSRAFNWPDIPMLESEFDRLVEAVASKKGDEKEQQNNEKLLAFSSLEKKPPLIQVDYSMALMLAQLFKENSEAIEKLKEMKQLTGRESKEELLLIEERLNLARSFALKHASQDQKISFAEKIDKKALKLEQKAVKLFPKISEKTLSAESAEELQSFVFSLAKENNIQPQELFTALYSAIIARSQGPKFGSLAFALGRRKIAERLRQF